MYKQNRKTLNTSRWLTMGCLHFAFSVICLVPLNSFGVARSATALLGFSQSAVNIGANYEQEASENLGVGGYFIHSSEKKDNARKHQVISFGGLVVGHLISTEQFEVTLSPGFGILMIKGHTTGFSNDDQTTFGPIWKTGFKLWLTDHLAVGLEHTELINWFADKAADRFGTTNAALTMNF